MRIIFGTISIMKKGNYAPCSIVIYPKGPKKVDFMDISGIIILVATSK